MRLEIVTHTAVQARFKVIMRLLAKSQMTPNVMSSTMPITLPYTTRHRLAHNRLGSIGMAIALANTHVHACWVSYRCSCICASPEPSLGTRLQDSVTT